MIPVTDIEARRQTAQRDLDGLKSAGERNQLGQFATPPALALEMARCASELWKDRASAVRFLDPGVGTGAFYAAFLKAFPRGCCTKAAGVELDPAFAEAATSLWSRAKLKVIRGDFTQLQPPRSNERFNMVLTNPPYVRHHHLGPNEKKRLQAMVARNLNIRVSGLAGLYCYFLLLAHEWLTDDGLALWLIPSEFMDVNYGRAVKEYLVRHVTLLRIHRFAPTDVQFEDALVTSAVVIFEKQPPPTSHVVRFSLGGSLLEPSSQTDLPLSALGDVERKWTAYFDNPSGRIAATRPAVTLGDVFDVKRGIATGANSFFILAREEARKRGIPDRFLKSILPSPRHLQKTIIGRGEEGWPRIETPLALIDCEVPEARLRRECPALFNYFEDGKRQGIDRRYLTSGRSPWYAQEKRTPVPFLCTYMGRNRDKPFRFFWNKSDAIAANVYLLLYPKGPLVDALTQDPRLASEVFAILRRLSPQSLRKEGRVYGGGLYKMEPKELLRLPADSFLKIVRLPDRARTLPFDCRDNRGLAYSSVRITKGASGSGKEKARHIVHRA